MDKKSLLTEIYNSFFENTLPEFALRAGVAFTARAGITPDSLIKYDLMYGLMRSALTNTTVCVTEQVAYKIVKPVNFKYSIVIHFSLEYCSVIISKCLIPSRRDFFTLAIEPPIIATLSTIRFIINNFDKFLDWFLDLDHKIVDEFKNVLRTDFMVLQPIQLLLFVNGVDPGEFFDGRL